MRAKLACGLRFDFWTDAVSASGTFCRTMSDAKMVEVERRRQAAERVRAEGSVLIISISTKTIVGLSGRLGNKNLRPPSIFSCPAAKLVPSRRAIAATRI